jgi:hypothetical protein
MIITDKKCAETTAHVCVTNETYVLTMLIIARRLPRCRIYLRQRHHNLLVTMGLLVAHHVWTDVRVCAQLVGLVPNSVIAQPYVGRVYLFTEWY